MILKDNENNMNSSYMQYLTEKIDWTNDMLKLMSQMFPPMTDSQKYYDFIISFYTNCSLSDLQESGDKLDIIDQVFIKGEPLATFKDPFEFLDNLIEKASTPFILININMNDYIYYIHDIVLDIVKMNEDALIQYETLQSLFDASLNDTFSEYILNEIKSNYYGTTLSSKIDIIDKIITSHIIEPYDDIGTESGLPGENSLIEIQSSNNHLVNEGSFMNDSITLYDGTPL